MSSGIISRTGVQYVVFTHFSAKVSRSCVYGPGPSQFFYEYLEDKYLDLIQHTLYREIGEGTILNYRILVETENNTAVELRGRPSLMWVRRTGMLPARCLRKCPALLTGWRLRSSIPRSIPNIPFSIFLKAKVIALLVQLPKQLP